jgi:hypothetical protein
MAAVTRLQALQDRRVCFFFRVKNGVSTWHGLTIQWLGGANELWVSIVAYWMGSVGEQKSFPTTW